MDNIVVQYVAPPPVTITASAASVAGGTVTGDGTFANGATVLLTATPNAGYAFVNWTEGGVPVSVDPTYSFPALTNRLLVANFAAIIIPRLDIQLAAGSVVLSWPTNSTGFTLEQNPALGTTNWTTVTNAITVVGANNQVVVSPLTGSAFFRLTHP